MKDQKGEIFGTSSGSMFDEVSSAASILRGFASRVGKTPKAERQDEGLFFQGNDSFSEETLAKSSNAELSEASHYLVEKAHSITDDFDRKTLISAEVQVAPGLLGQAPKVVFLRELGKASKKQLDHARRLSEELRDSKS